MKNPGRLIPRSGFFSVMYVVRVHKQQNTAHKHVLRMRCFSEKTHLSAIKAPCVIFRFCGAKCQSQSGTGKENDASIEKHRPQAVFFYDRLSIQVQHNQMSKRTYVIRRTLDNSLSYVIRKAIGYSLYAIFSRVSPESCPRCPYSHLFRIPTQCRYGR